jgi:hypothetical protein
VLLLVTAKTPRTSRELETKRNGPSTAIGWVHRRFNVYTVDLDGPPGSVTEEQALKIANAYYERLAGN